MDTPAEVIDRVMSRVWKLVGGLAAVAAAVMVALVAGGGIGTGGRTAAAVEIARPPAEVFAYLVRPELLPAWMGNLLESRPTSQPWPRVGAKAIERVGTVDDAHELEVEITALEANRLLELAITHPEFTSQARYALRERDGRTVLVYEAHSAYTHPVARLLSPVVERRNQSKLEEDLLRLKLALEGPPKPAAATPATAAAPAIDAPVGEPAPPTPVSESATGPAAGPGAAPTGEPGTAAPPASDATGAAAATGAGGPEEPSTPSPPAGPPPDETAAPAPSAPGPGTAEQPPAPADEAAAPPADGASVTP